MTMWNPWRIWPVSTTMASAIREGYKKEFNELRLLLT